MKMTLLALFTLAGLSTALVAATAQTTGEVRHVVVFKFKEGSTAAELQQITTAFLGLKDRIPGVVSIEHGLNNSPEGLNKGFTHVYLVTFTDTKARDVYLPHPEHQKFGQLLASLDVLEDVFVVDFVTGP